MGDCQSVPSHETLPFWLPFRLLARSLSRPQITFKYINDADTGLDDAYMKWCPAGFPVRAQSGHRSGIVPYFNRVTDADWIHNPVVYF